MIQTSYFANWRNFPDNKRKISISRFTPKWFEEDYNALELAPSKELLLETKAGNVTDEEYTKRYKEETLSKLNPGVIAKKYKDSIFLCYESSDDFCHRQLVADWLRENEIPVEEVINKKNIYIKVVDFEDYDFFKKVMDRLLSNYKNIIIDGEHEFVFNYTDKKMIHMEMFATCDMAMVFKDNDNEEKIEDIKDIYIINGKTKKVFLQKD